MMGRPQRMTDNQLIYVLNQNPEGMSLQQLAEATGYERSTLTMRLRNLEGTRTTRHPCQCGISEIWTTE